MREIVRQAQAGDRSAFERIYRENVGRVHALCLRLCGDPARAEELTQDVFVRAWRRLGTFRGDSAFSTWLHRLAVNEVYQAFRSERRRHARVMATDDLSVYEHANPEAVPRPGRRIDLEEAIRALPPGARTAFVLHDIEGYKHREIAELTGQAIGTSKAQLHRARKLLREALER